MSDQQHTDALLVGYNAPKFPDALVALGNAVALTGLNYGHAFTRVAEKINGYFRRDRITTSDGYMWFWAIHFTVEGGEIAVLFPWFVNQEALDNNQRERSLAVYTKGNVSETDASALVEIFTQKMYELWTEDHD